MIYGNSMLNIPVVAGLDVVAGTVVVGSAVVVTTERLQRKRSHSFVTSSDKTSTISEL
jgi:hypothetical protein